MLGLARRRRKTSEMRRWKRRTDLSRKKDIPITFPWLGSCKWAKRPFSSRRSSIGRTTAPSAQRAFFIPRERSPNVRGRGPKGPLIVPYTQNPFAEVSTKEEKFDAAAMHQKAKSEPVKLVDDGSGKVEVETTNRRRNKRDLLTLYQIWRIEDFEMAPLDRKLYGQFFAGDSYVILYTYLIEGVEYYIIYFWQVSYSRASIKTF